MTDTVVPSGFHVPPRIQSTTDADAPAGISSATRYLAGAAYTDSAFRNGAIAMDRHAHLAHAPELGIDREFVLRECYKARRRTIIRSLTLLPVLIFVLFEIGRGYSETYSPVLDDVINTFLYPLLGAWLVAAIIVFVDKFVLEHAILTRKFGPQCVDVKAERTAQPLAPRQNVVVYGGFSPFVGSGFDLSGWSFAVNLERGNSSGEKPKRFDATELYAALCAGFERLKIPGCSLQDRLYVDGTAIRNDRRFLPDEFGQPIKNVSDDVVELFRREPGKRIRHYLCIEISDWSGELVLSNFVRLHTSDSKLFIEVSNFLLPPLKAEYYSLDLRTPTRMVRKTISWFLMAVLLAPFYIIGAPLILWAALTRALQEGKRNSAEIEHNPLYNYGARASIRERATVNAWRVYFQKLDKEMHSKVILQQLLDVMIEFLEERGIDTSEIKDRGSHILNNGIIISGGAVNAESLAVGEGARSHSAGRRTDGGKS